MGRLAVIWILAMTAGSFAADDYVWWEGEAPLKHNFTNRAFGVGHTERRHGLSNSDWLHTGGTRGKDEIFATYEITTPADGEYHFWTRKFWKHGPFRWRFDEQEWKECDRDCPLMDNYSLWTHVGVDWVPLGKVKLTKGKHTFELRLLAKEGENVGACFDCFVLSLAPFSPNGKMKPGEKLNKFAPGWWSFEPSLDTFKSDALLDLRYLNEREAGESGFVQRAGLDFKLGNGKPVKFWAVNYGPDQTHEQLDYIAAKLAKAGVNMVRMHGAVFEGNDPTKPNEKYLDGIFYFVAALKKQGIYSKLSFYFPVWMHAKDSLGLAGYDAMKGGKQPFALLYFDPRMQEIYKGWAKMLLNRENPYTKKTLAKDPAVAIVEIINEDSFFFWTFGERNIPPVQMTKLEKMFGDWAAKRHGSLEKALESWGEKHPRDNAAGGIAGLFDAWHMTAQGSKQGGASKTKRMGEQVRFLTETQRNFYADITKYFKQDLGVQSLVSASNWHTTDPVTLDALERYTYTATDVIDKHGYFGGKHEGDGAGFSVRVGHTYQDRAAVLEPEAPPLSMIQCDGFPHIISEVGWPSPNRFRAEFAPLASAYGALQGTDGIFFFALNGPGWNVAPPKFAVSVPSVLGQFPAMALQYRRGDVKESDTLIHQVLDLEDLYALKGSGAAEAQNLDALRAADVPPGGSAQGKAVASIDPLACYAGRIVRSYDKDKSKSKLTDLSKLIDRQNKTIKSATGELLWDFGKGFTTVNTPRSQGVSGFLSKAGAVDLGDVALTSNNEFGTVHVISLDANPIKTSKKLLVQAFTDEQPYGWKVENGKIADLGGPPLNVKNVEASVTLKNWTSAKITVLDENGYAKKQLDGKADKGAWTFTLPADSLYLIVERP